MFSILKSFYQAKEKHCLSSYIPSFFFPLQVNLKRKSLALPFNDSTIRQFLFQKKENFAIHFINLCRVDNE